MKRLPYGYLVEKLTRVIPLFEEARDALTAITETQRRLRNISPTLADRMDAAGTYTEDDWLKASGEPLNGELSPSPWRSMKSVPRDGSEILVSPGLGAKPWMVRWVVRPRAGGRFESIGLGAIRFEPKGWMHLPIMFTAPEDDE